MKKYFSFFRLRFAMGLQYRIAALAGISTQFFWGLMEIMIFRAFYQTDASAFPMTLSATTSYIWLQQAFLAFIPYPYGIAAPAGPAHFLLFIVTLFLGLAVMVSFCMLVYVLTFFTISPQGLRILFVSCVEFFSGALIPLPFFPEKIRQVMELLPFASMQNVALRIYSADMNRQEIERAVLLQIFWLIVVTLSGKLLCKAAEKHITVQGG